MTPVQFFDGTPKCEDQMWQLECRSVLAYCRGKGLDVGAGGRTLDPTVTRIDCFADYNPNLVVTGVALPFEDGAFDYVFTCHTLEHFPDPVAALREWLRVVKPGGYVCSVIPDTRYTKAQNTDRTPHYFEWAPREFLTDVLQLKWPGLWYEAQGPVPRLNAELVALTEACPSWSFAVVLRRGA